MRFVRWCFYLVFVEQIHLLQSTTFRLTTAHQTCWHFEEVPRSSSALLTFFNSTCSRSRTSVASRSPRVNVSSTGLSPFQWSATHHWGALKHMHNQSTSVVDVILTTMNFNVYGIKNSKPNSWFPSLDWVIVTEVLNVVFYFAVEQHARGCCPFMTFF